MNTYDLVAINWDRNSNELDLVKALGGALIEWSIDFVDDGRDKLRFTINNEELRNTVAHGIGCDLGFICHIEETR